MTASNPFAERLRAAAAQGYIGTPRTYRSSTKALATMAKVPASSKQIELIANLLEEKDLAAEKRLNWYNRLMQLAMIDSELHGLDQVAASNLITYLMGMPSKPGPVGQVSVPAGRYAVEHNGKLVFVVVDKPERGKWAGHTFVKVQHGPSVDRINRGYGDKLLKAIREAGPEAASIRYGKELGICGRCNTELTNPESRAAGIGPVCRNKGW